MTLVVGDEMQTIVSWAASAQFLYRIASDIDALMGHTQGGMAADCKHTQRTVTEQRSHLNGFFLATFNFLRFYGTAAQPRFP